MTDTATQNALNRGQELAGTKAKDVPLLALRYQRALCNRVGMCGETMLTALCWYAEQEEKLAPSDDLYDLHLDDATTKAVIKEANSTSWKPDWWDSING